MLTLRCFEPPLRAAAPQSATTYIAHGGMQGAFTGIFESAFRRGFGCREATARVVIRFAKQLNHNKLSRATFTLRQAFIGFKIGASKRTML
ncbi:MAG: hypothetical protein H7A47_09785 [Verrucomicrobiales bacterium]|nr:hypothetical protein [Verrucomicrobiales bacterium]